MSFVDQTEKSNAFGLKALSLIKELASGYVLTAKLGIYIIPELFSKHKKIGNNDDFINSSLLEKHNNFGGIRIEDDFVIIPDRDQLLKTPLVPASNNIESIRKYASS